MTLNQIPRETALELTAGERRFIRIGLLLAILCAIVAFFQPRQFFRAYLTGYLFILGLTLGSLGIAMVHQLSGGAWGVMIRRSLGAATRTLPLVTLLFLPILAGARFLYPWTDAALVAHDTALQWKRPYLNMPFFIVRAAIYFAVWNAISIFLNRWSLEQDSTADPNMGRRMRALSAVGLLAYGITITFASFDWLMSIEPRWYSTMFGVLTMGAQGLSGFAFAILVLDWLSRRPPLSDVVKPAHFHDLGNLLLAFVMLWAYFAFSQFLIIWSGNLPEEIQWYQRRLSGGWWMLGLAIIVFHFAVPFVLLLSRALKQNSRWLAAVAALLLVLRVCDLDYLIAPAFLRQPLSVLDVLAPAALAVLWLALFARQLRQRPLLPIYDPEFAEAIS